MRSGLCREGKRWYQALASSGLAIQVRTEVLVLDTSQCVKGLEKELVCPRGDVRILRLKEGSNGHEGCEVETKYLDTTGT